MPRGNGGVLGPANIPTTSVAKGVWSLMEQQLAQRQGIWPAGPLGFDPYFEYTTLLLPGNGTNGAQNNTFLDGSTNNFTITRNGNTTQGTFSPFSQTGWGNYFGGTDGFLTTATNSAFTFGTGDFTVELWCYPISSTGPGGYAYLYAQGPNTTSALGIYFQSNTFRVWNGSTVITGTVSRSTNTWYHVALSRSGTSMKLFVNGVQDGSTATNSSNITTGSTYGAALGRWVEISDPNYFVGYLSSVRAVKGTAVYTSDFTPPTSPLTAISGTSLLTCQSNRFIDNSTNNFTITPAGNTSVVAFSPFNPSASWSAATYGGSGYFDGSGDYLSAASNTAFNLTGDYTVECWFYANSFPGQPAVFGIGSDAAGLVLTIVSSKVYAYFVGVGNVFGSGGTTLITNSWNHIAIVRSGTTNTCYINGSQSGTTYSSSSTVSSTGGVGIGRTVAGTSFNDWNGYVTDFRIVKGTAVYTGNFTPPTAPLTAITNTSLLLNFTNAGIYDATSKNDLETVGNAQISTTQSKWGGSSMYFDGTGDWLISPKSTLYEIGGGDWTCEFWVYGTSFSSLQILNAYEASSGAGYSAQSWAIYAYTGKLGIEVTNGSSAVVSMLSTSSIPTSSWAHLAITRSGSTWRMFINGTLDATTATYAGTPYVPSNAVLSVGSAPTRYPMTGYIQDLRITKGYARYTASFTAPTAAFPTL